MWFLPVITPKQKMNSIQVVIRKFFVNEEVIMVVSLYLSKHST